MASNDDELRGMQHAVALLRLHWAQDTDAFVRLVGDPDVSLPDVVLWLCEAMRWVLTATGNGEFLERLSREMLSAAADPAAFSDRLNGRGGAMVAAEQFVNRRLGVELAHQTPAEGATVTGHGPYVVRSAFQDPGSGRMVAYTCSVERADDSWRLVDLQTDRC